MGCGLTPVVLALLEVINRSTHQRARESISTRRITPALPPAAVVPWRMTLCAINGCEQLQQGTSTELLRQRRNGGLRYRDRDGLADRCCLRLKTDRRSRTADLVRSDLTDPSISGTHVSSSTTVQMLACGSSAVGGRMVLNSSLISPLSARVRRTVKTVLMGASRHRSTTN